MDLIKKSVHINNMRGKSESQITLDDDVNVPDKYPDINTLITKSGNIEIDTVKISKNKINVKGKLNFSIMYKAESDKENAVSVQKLDGTINFDEIINMDGIEEGDSVGVDLKIDDLSITVVNSRKISVKALIDAIAIAENIRDEDFSTGINNDDVMYIKDTISLTQIAVKKKDLLRVKEDINLVSGKLNINEIIWSTKTLTQSNVKLSDDKINISGEIAVFVLYSSDDGPLQWTNATVPFNGDIAVEGCTEEMIPNISLKLNSCQIEAKPDYDGEPRILSFDGIISVDVKLYEEQQFEIVKDAYSRDKDLVLDTKKTDFENILMKNIVKCRVSEKIKQDNKIDDSHVMQICNCTGDIKIDETRIEEDGIGVEGAIDVNVLYICSDDSSPICCLSDSIPFSQKIDINGMNPDCVYQINATPEQINSNMSGTDEVEVKATVSLDCIAFEKLSADVVQDIEEKDYDYDKIAKMPGIVAYVCKDGDTLWSIEKKFYSTADSINEINNIKREVAKDQMIVVAKKM